MLRFSSSCQNRIRETMSVAKCRQRWKSEGARGRQERVPESRREASHGVRQVNQKQPPRCQAGERAGDVAVGIQVTLVTVPLCTLRLPFSRVFVLTLHGAPPWLVCHAQ